MLLLLSLIISTVNASISFGLPGRQALAFPTVDYFQNPSDAYNHSRCLIVQTIPAIDDDKQGCKFEPIRFQEVFGDDAKKTCGVVMLGWEQAMIAGCHNIVEASKGVLTTFVPSLPEKPRKNLILAIAIPAYGSELGGPVTTPYLSHSVSVGDATPAMKVVFMASDDAAKYLEDFGEEFGVDVQIEQEAGPWNKVFMSVWFKIYSYGLSAINWLIIVISLYYLVQIWRDGRIRRLDTPVTIYIFTFLSAVVFTVSLYFQRQTRLTFLLQDLASLTYHCALYLFLILWSRMMPRVRRLYQVLFQLCDSVTLMIAIANYVQQVVWLSNWPKDSLRDWHNVFRILAPSSQLLLGLVCALLYIFGSKPVVVTTNHRQAFVRVTQLVAFGFCALAVYAITFVLLSQPQIAGSIGGICALYVMNDVAGTLRAVVLFMILSDEIGGYIYTRGRGTNQRGGSWRQLDLEPEPEQELEMEMEQEEAGTKEHEMQEFPVQNNDAELRHRKKEEPKWVPITEEMMREYQT